MEVLDICEGPVIFSHANPHALHSHERNIKDDQATRCAETGGVIGINGIGIFLGDNDASTERLLRQVEYYVDLVGFEHVGIGLDFLYDKSTFLKGIQGLVKKYPEGHGYDRLDMEIAEPEQLPELTDTLVSRGYSEEQIRAFLGENWLRVASRVWK